MFRKKFPAGLFLLPLLAGVCGCPWFGTPSLSVSPTALSFDSVQLTATVILTNEGGGTLTWRIEAMPEWLSASSGNGELGASNSQVIVLTANPQGLAANLYSGVVVVSSNGGTRNIAVSLLVIPSPTLAVNPSTLDFGVGETSLTFAVRNSGAGTLVWNITQPLPEGFQANVLSGNTTADVPATVVVTFDRAGRTPGEYNAAIEVTSNGGSASVALHATVQALVVTPATLDFGQQLDQLPVTIANIGLGTLNWAIDGTGLPTWVSFDPPATAGALDAGGEYSLLVNVDRAALGNIAGETSFRVTSSSGSVTVRISVEAPTPGLLVTPLLLNFGSSSTEETFTIQNTGTGDLLWNVEEGIWSGNSWSPQDIPWLGVAGDTSGTLIFGASIDVAATVDRLQATPDPDNPYVAYLRVTAQDGQYAIVEVQQRTLPPTLSVLPTSLAFGTTAERKQLAIWNSGLGSISWTVDTAGHPEWVTVSPVDASGIASGNVSGEQTDTVTVVIDRTTLTPATQDYRWTFEVEGVDGTGAPVLPITVTVSANKAKFPVIVLDTGNVDGNGIDFLPFGTVSNLETFTISNIGTGVLSWRIDMTLLPAWITSVEPAQGAIEPGGSVIVTVKVDRTDLSFGNALYTVLIVSNDPASSQKPMRVELQVPKKVVIGVRPTAIAMGLTAISTEFEVANTGDPGSLLNFQVSSNKPWLYFYPETGTSEGTSSPTKDWQTVSISIDRGQLESTGGAATLTVTAYETDENGQRVLLESVEPQEVELSVEAAALTLEGPPPRTRIPSLVRFVFMLRDIAYNVLPLPEAIVRDYTNQFTIYEKDIALEYLETNQFLTGGENLRTRVVILLDYSGSMVAAAQAVLDPDIAGAPDPIQALYNRCIEQLIDELPAHYSIGLMEFHDRAQPTRRIWGTDGNPFFTTDKEVLKQRLEGAAIVAHGATELLPAVMDAADVLASEAGLLVPFDDTDVNALICVSDGRLTTPPGKIKEASDYVLARGVRFLGVGWGDGVLHDPLARLASGTGGHYYPTRTEATGEEDEFGNPVFVPIVGELYDLCATEDPLVDPCDQSVPKDLQSQVVLSYVTLTEDSPVTVRVDGVFDDPNDDDSICVDDQGLISGSVKYKQMDFLSIVGDNNLGQISLRTEGILNNQARVVVRGEYMPRNIGAMTFVMSSSQAFSVALAPQDEGGMAEDWTLTNEGGGVYSLTPPSPGMTFQYGLFGDLFYVDFPAVALPGGDDSFRFFFDVTEPVYNPSDVNTKYFVYPDSILIAAQESFAPAFPTVSVATGPLSNQFTIANLGGSHEDTGVELFWYIDGYPDFIATYTPLLYPGTVVSSLSPVTVTMVPATGLTSGTYEGTVYLTVYTGLALSPTYWSVPISITVP